MTAPFHIQKCNLTTAFMWLIGGVLLLSCLLKAVNVYSFSQPINSFCGLLGLNGFYGYEVILAISASILQPLFSLFFLNRLPHVPHLCLCIAKDAVVESGSCHVISRYEDGHAVWTYFDIVYSNINSFAITGCQLKNTSIHEGEIVITSGNLNMADGTDVKQNQ